MVRRNTEQVQGQGDFVLLDELFADDFVDHTPQPGTTPDKAGVGDFTNDCATRFRISDPRSIGKPSTATSPPRTRSTTALRDGKITYHWGVANLILRPATTRTNTV
ncbi:MAG TPA: hypothetical protein VJ777_31995 [Mycobacterium sp.]|nr:hypothetical protein [Mycobacterium sp.]